VLITGFRILRLFNIEGIVIYPFILIATRNPGKSLLNHERIHLDQIKKIGLWAFYTRYFKEYLAGRRCGLTHDQAYRQISFEQEAYNHQNDQNYVV
jgi:hypothetical protein